MKLGAVVLISMIWIPATFAADAEFPAQVEFSGQTLHLLGWGYRTATWLKIKVYRAGFYVTDVKADPLTNGSLKVIDLVFTRDISLSDIQKAWKENFAKSCASGCKVQKETLAKFIADLKDVKNGERFRYIFYVDHVEIVKPNGTSANYADAAFSPVLLSTWIGEFPAQDSLKKALLGNK